jgi:hypothetical protein
MSEVASMLSLWRFFFLAMIAGVRHMFINSGIFQVVLAGALSDCRFTAYLAPCLCVTMMYAFSTEEQGAEVAPSCH